MANDINGIFGGNNMNVDPNQRVAVNNAQIQRNNAQINSLGGNPGYMPILNYGNNGFMSNGYNTFQPQQQFLKCRPVTSIEEARAAQIDLDGSLWVFTDIGHGKIYTKQIGNDGSSAFGVYTYIEEAPISNNTNINVNNFVTKEEMNTAVQDAVRYILNMLPKQDAAAAPDKSDKSAALTF